MNRWNWRLDAPHKDFVSVFLTVLASAVSGTSQQLPPEVLEHVDSGRAAMNTHQYQEAAAEFRRVVKMCTTCAVCYVATAIYNLRMEATKPPQMGFRSYELYSGRMLKD